MINERFGELNTRLDAMDESLDQVQDLLHETLSRLDKTDQRIADLAAQSQRQFTDLRSGQQKQMNALLAVVQKLDVIEEKVDDIPRTVVEMRFQDFIYEFESIVLEMNGFFQDFNAISQQRHRELAIVKSLQQAYRSCGAPLHAVTTAMARVENTSMAVTRQLQHSFAHSVEKFSQIAALAVEGKFTRMHFDTIVMTAAEVVKGNATFMDELLLHDNMAAAIVEDQSAMYGGSRESCAQSCGKRKVMQISPCKCSDGSFPQRRVMGKYLYTTEAAQIFHSLLEDALDGVPLQYTISLMNYYSQLKVLLSKFASWDMLAEERFVQQMEKAFEKIAFDFESLRRHHAMKETDQQVVLGSLELATELLDILGPHFSPAPAECQKPALLELGQADLSRLVYWGPVPLKSPSGAVPASRVASLIMRRPSKLLHTQALAWLHDFDATACSQISYPNIKDLMESSFICWTEQGGKVKVRSLCDPAGLGDVVDTSALRWVEKEKKEWFRDTKNSKLVTPIDAMLVRTTPLDADLFRFWGAAVEQLAAGHCGNGKLDMIEECDSPGEGCKDCQVVPGYDCPVPGRPCVARCGDHKPVKHEDCDENNLFEHDGCSPTCQLEYCGRTRISKPVRGRTPDLSMEDLSLCGTQLPDSSAKLDCGTYQELTFTGFTKKGRWVRHDVRLKKSELGDATIPMPTTEPIHGSPYKLWSDGRTFSVTCSGADTATDCLFVGMALNKSSEFFGHPWLVQSHHGENSSLDTIATVLHVYGRSLHPLGQSDLEQCDSASTKLVMLDCGDGLVTGDEECDPPGKGCDAECKIIDGWMCEPNLCQEICGDGRVVGDEVCDDGNLLDDDWCAADCRSGRSTCHELQEAKASAMPAGWYQLMTGNGASQAVYCNLAVDVGSCQALLKREAATNVMLPSGWYSLYTSTNTSIVSDVAAAEDQGVEVVTSTAFASEAFANAAWKLSGAAALAWSSTSPPKTWHLMSELNDGDAATAWEPQKESGVDVALPSVSLVHGVSLTGKSLSSVTLEFAHASSGGKGKAWTRLATVPWADSAGPVTQHWRLKEPVRTAELRLSATGPTPAFHEVQVWAKVSEVWNILSDGFTTMAYCSVNYTNRSHASGFTAGVITPKTLPSSAEEYRKLCAESGYPEAGAFGGAEFPAVLASQAAFVAQLPQTTWQRPRMPGWLFPSSGTARRSKCRASA